MQRIPPLKSSRFAGFERFATATYPPYQLTAVWQPPLREPIANIHD